MIGRLVGLKGGIKLSSQIRAHIRRNVVGYVAIFLALSGTVYAAGKINGKQIKPNSIPGNRIKPGTLTGTQIDAGTLGVVPNAKSAGTANNANNLGGVDPTGFGAVMTERGDLPALPGSGDLFYPVSGVGGSAGTASPAQQLMPNRALVARDFNILLDNVQTVHVDVSLVVGGVSHTLCSNLLLPTVAPHATCASNTTIAVPAGSSLAWQIHNDDGSGNTMSLALFAFRLTPT